MGEVIRFHSSGIGDEVPKRPSSPLKIIDFPHISYEDYHSQILDTVENKGGRNIHEVRIRTRELLDTYWDQCCSDPNFGRICLDFEAALEINDEALDLLAQNVQKEGIPDYLILYRYIIHYFNTDFERYLAAEIGLENDELSPNFAIIIKAATNPAIK